MSEPRPQRTVACRRLRTKWMFMDWEDDPSVPDTHDGFYWCTHTMNCLGPDGEVADEERCRRGRTCFERL